MERIGIEVIHARVLAIAKEFDKICTRHQIPYYMLGGTMLGAIRHKGFIPWDDDMDFGVPMAYYDQLEKILKEELPSNYRCCTYKNHPAVIHNYFKIEDRETVLDDRTRFSIPLEEQLGVNIDVFPLCKCQLNDPIMKKVHFYKNLLGAFMNSRSRPNSITRKFAKAFLRFIAGGSPLKVNEKMDLLLHNTDKGECLGNLLGHWGAKEIIPCDWYGSGVRYSFGDTSFVGIKSYDKYLTKLYGNYMQLPPEEKRVPHEENVYLR